MIPDGYTQLQTSGFINTNNGYIINSSIAGLKFNLKDENYNLFTYGNYAYIMNCRIKNDVKNISINDKQTLISRYNYGNIFNIFVENYQNNFYGICYKNETRGQYYNCILPEKFSGHYIYNDESNYLKGVIFYSDSEEEYKNIADILNKWIDEDGKERYPTITFRKWKTDPAEKVVFE